MIEEKVPKVAIPTNNIRKPQRSWWLRFINWVIPSRVANIYFHHRQKKQQNYYRIKLKSNENFKTNKNRT